MDSPNASPRRRGRRHSFEYTDPENSSVRVDSTLNYLSGSNPPPREMSDIDNDLMFQFLHHTDLFKTSGSETGNCDSFDARAVIPTISDVKREDSKRGNKRKATKDVCSTEDEKRLKRERQREIARNFRRRKKERMAELELEVTRLREANKRLKLRLSEKSNAKLAADVATTSNLRVSHIKTLQSLIETHSKTKATTSVSKKASARIKDIVKEHIDFFADTGRIRKAGLQHHIRELKKLMLPTSVTKLCVWGLQQPPEFFKDVAEEDHLSDTGEEVESLWGIICRKLALTESQKSKIIQNRSHVGEQRQNIAATIKLIGELEKKISDTLSMNESLLQSIMGAITPIQQAKYLVWQEHNEACMQMLDHLWRIMPVTNIGANDGHTSTD